MAGPDSTTMEVLAPGAQAERLRHRSADSDRCSPAVCSLLISFRFARALGFWFFGCLFCFMFPQTCQPHSGISLHKLTFCFYIIGLPFPSFPSLSQGTVAFTYLFIYFPFTLLCSVAAVIRKWVILG